MHTEALLAESTGTLRVLALTVPKNFVADVGGCAGLLGVTTGVGSLLGGGCTTIANGLPRTSFLSMRMRMRCAPERAAVKRSVKRLEPFSSTRWSASESTHSIAHASPLAHSSSDQSSRARTSSRVSALAPFSLRTLSTMLALRCALACDRPSPRSSKTTRGRRYFCRSSILDGDCGALPALRAARPVRDGEL